MKMEDKKPKREFGELSEGELLVAGMIIGAYFYHMTIRIIELYF